MTSKKIEPTGVMVDEAANVLRLDATHESLRFHAGMAEHTYHQRAQTVMRAALTAALPHLTADDLRNTPAGKQLMAEAWEDGALHQARGSAETLRVLASALPNPYKETPNE